MDLIRFILDNGDSLIPQTLDHLQIVAVTMVISAATGLTLGIVASRSPRLGEGVLGVASTLLTIPSFALFSVLTTLFIALGLQIGDPPVIAGLVLYAQLPIIRNTRAGITAVSPSVLESARGMGMTNGQVLTRVELPLALPVILGGFRQATVMIVAIATVGAAVGSPNLGRPIVDTLQRSGSSLPILAGITGVAIIGIGADTLLGGVQRLLSRGRITPEHLP
ncbi:MAG TPA: ABC transporter permease [Candidatus Dormibacteraeota bacterium]|jgi:osmoprotectant transport system permease protein|nr:ABC transporter permease [Candidatus Dormibacteraeota bacterium]